MRRQKRWGRRLGKEDSGSQEWQVETACRTQKHSDMNFLTASEEGTYYISTVWPLTWPIIVCSIEYVNWKWMLSILKGYFLSKYVKMVPPMHRKFPLNLFQIFWKAQGIGLFLCNNIHTLAGGSEIYTYIYTYIYAFLLYK